MFYSALSASLPSIIKLWTFFKLYSPFFTHSYFLACQLLLACMHKKASSFALSQNAGEKTLDYYMCRVCKLTINTYIQRLASSEFFKNMFHLYEIIPLSLSFVSSFFLSALFCCLLRPVLSSICIFGNMIIKITVFWIVNNK